MSESDTNSQRSVDFEESLQLKLVAEDTFTNVHPGWWFATEQYVPGSVSMTQSAFAAYQTVPAGFSLHFLQAHFLASCPPKKPMQYKVQRVSTSRSFAVRQVTLSVDDVQILLATISFTKPPARGSNEGPFLTFSPPAPPDQIGKPIEFDEVQATIRTKGPDAKVKGPFFATERLPFPNSGSIPPQPMPNRFRGHPLPPAQTHPHLHILSVISMSDVWIMEAPIVFFDLSIGLPRVGDRSQTLTIPNTRKFTTINHSIHFHRVDGFRADEDLYVELVPEWAGEGRVLATSRFWSSRGDLVATAAQEGLCVLKKDTPLRPGLTKL